MGSHSVTFHPTQANTPRLLAPLKSFDILALYKFDYYYYYYSPQPDRLVLDLPTI